MKAKFGAIVVDGRGKIGGHVASKNKAGSYFRTKVTPTNPQSTSQSGVRSIFSGLAQGWRGLTEEQRASWRAGAINFPYVDIFGDTKQLSGFGLYMQLNGNLVNVGTAALTDCPSPAEVTALTSLTFENDGGAYIVEALPATIPAGYAAVVLATPGLSAGRASSASYYRKIGVIAAASSVGTNFQDNYEAKFGTAPDETNNVFCSAYLVNLTTGQTSQQLTALGTAPVL